MKKNKLSILIAFLPILISIIVLIISFFNYSFSFIVLLPLAYSVGFLFIFLFDVTFMKSIVKKLVMVLFACRMLIYPSLLIIDNSSIISNISIYCVLLQIYEFIITMWIIIFFKTNYTNSTLNLEIDLYKTKVLKRLIVILIFASIGLIILYPTFLNIYKPLIFSSVEDQIKWNNATSHITDDIPIIIYQFGRWLIQLCTLLVAYFVVIVLKNKKELDDNKLFPIFLSLLPIGLLLIFVTSDKAGAFFAAGALLLLLMNLHKKYKKIIIKIGIIGLLFAFTLVFLVMPIRQKDNKKIYETINEYFSGSENIEAGLKMPNYNSYEYIKGDIFRYIPMVVSFYTECPQSNDLYNYVLGKDIKYNSQIMPTIIQGRFYFGFILSPIFTVLLLLFALRSEKKANNCSDSFGFFVYYYFSIFFSSGIILYYFSLTVYLVLQYVFPLWVMYKLFVRREKSV